MAQPPPYPVGGFPKRDPRWPLIPTLLLLTLHLLAAVALLVAIDLDFSAQGINITAMLWAIISVIRSLLYIVVLLSKPGKNLLNPRGMMIMYIIQTIAWAVILGCFVWWYNDDFTEFYCPGGWGFEGTHNVTNPFGGTFTEPNDETCLESPTTKACIGAMAASLGLSLIIFIFSCIMRSRETRMMRQAAPVGIAMQAPPPFEPLHEQHSAQPIYQPPTEYAVNGGNGGLNYKKEGGMYVGSRSPEVVR